MKKEFLFLLIVLASCLILSNAFAEQYDGSIIYVNAVIGNDSWTGWAPTHDSQYQDHGPKKTIMAACGQNTAPNVTIIVADGIYIGPDNIGFADILEQKSLTLRSANGPENCIIDCGAQSAPFQFVRPHNPDEPGAVMDGFTIINARDIAVKFGNSSAATIANCVLSGNWIAASAGVITCRNRTTAHIVNCTIESNTGEQSAAGIRCTNSAPNMTGCSIVAPATPAWQFAYAISSLNALPTITGCTIFRSTGIGIHLMSDEGVVPEYAAPIAVSDCTLTNNTDTALLLQADAVITDCRISSNTAEVGAGILLQADAVITDCTISSNMADLGAGIFVGDPENPYAYDGPDRIDVTISGCRITGNTAFSGPAVYSLDADVAINDCIVSENYALLYNQYPPGGRGASAICLRFGNFKITNSAITANYGEDVSGYAVGCFDAADVQIADCDISENFAFGAGGGIVFDGENGRDSEAVGLTVERCEIRHNTALQECYGIVCEHGAIRIANSVVAYTDSEEGPPPIGISARAEPFSNPPSSVDIVNCTVAGTGFGGEGPLGYGIEVYGPINITNSIVWYNGYGPGEAITGNRHEANVSYSNVEHPRYAEVVGNGNICVEPLFADTDIVQQGVPELGEDFHLKSEVGRYDPASESWVQDDVTSPGVDAGDPTMHVGDEPLSSGGRINMGAYGGTAQASITAICTGPIPADLNNDCMVNLTDLATVAQYWLVSTIEQPEQ